MFFAAPLTIGCYRIPLCREHGAYSQWDIRHNEEWIVTFSGKRIELKVIIARKVRQTQVLSVFTQTWHLLVWFFILNKSKKVVVGILKQDWDV